MSIILNPADEATTHLAADGWTTDLPKTDDSYTFVCWYKASAIKNSAVYFSIGVTGGSHDDYPVELYTLTAGSLYVVRTVALSAQEFVTSGVTLDTWQLIMATTTLKGTLPTVSDSRAINVDAAAFSQIDTDDRNMGLQASTLSLGVRRTRTGTTQFHCNKVKFAYPALYTGGLTTDHLDALYGSGPLAGDGKEPALVNSANLLGAARFVDGSTKSLINDNWVMVGSDFTANPEDNPILIQQAEPISTRSPSRRDVSVSQTSNAATISRSDITTINISTASIINGTHQATQFQIFEASQPLTDTPLINLTSGSGIRTNGNLNGLTKTQLKIILKFTTNYKIRFRVRDSGTWSTWSKPKSFKTRDKDYKRV